MELSASIAELKKLGIKTISIDEPMVDDTAAGKLAGNMLGVFNQYFSDSLSEKTKSRMQAAVKAGRFVWRCATRIYEPEERGRLNDQSRCRAGSSGAQRF